VSNKNNWPKYLHYRFNTARQVDLAKEGALFTRRGFDPKFRQLENRGVLYPLNIPPKMVWQEGPRFTECKPSHQTLSGRGVIKPNHCGRC